MSNNIFIIMIELDLNVSNCITSLLMQVMVFADIFILILIKAAKVTEFLI